MELGDVYMDLPSGLRFFREKGEATDVFKERILKGLQNHDDEQVEKILNKK